MIEDHRYDMVHARIVLDQMKAGKLDRSIVVGDGDLLGLEIEDGLVLFIMHRQFQRNLVDCGAQGGHL